MTLAAGSASEVGPSKNINCIDMSNKLTQKKPVLGERTADAARQHAHIDTNRTYNVTTRDRTCQRPPVRAEDRCVRGQDAVRLRRDLQGLRPTTPTPCDTCNGVDRAARAVPRVGAVSRPPRPQARVGRVGALCGALCGALTSLWALATREGRFGRTSRWTMTEGTRGVCGLSRAQRTSRSCVRGGSYAN